MFSLHDRKTSVNFRAVQAKHSTTTSSQGATGNRTPGFLGSCISQVFFLSSKVAHTFSKHSART